MTIRELDQGRRWQLPDGVEEILPPRAARIEALRRRLLDQFDLWGYQLVMPPLLEYLDSLLVAAGNDLDLQTFKVTDQLSGRMMGLRADITSQAARIDAHSLKHEGPTRLCYAGTVLRTRPQGLLGSRAPIRIGAELYGVQGPAGDAEVLALMVRTLQSAGVGPVQIELGHVAIYRSLAHAAGLAAADEAHLFDAVQRKAVADIEVALAETACPASIAAMIRVLPTLMGQADTLERAREVFATGPAEVMAAIDELEEIATRVVHAVDGLSVGFDLAELRGYNYHTGTVFSAYAEGHAGVVAGGGRYDDVGAAFGRARPATGFDADLKTLADLSNAAPAQRATVLAPSTDDLDETQQRLLGRAVQDLRREGVRVMSAPASTEVDEHLQWDGGAWVRMTD